MESFEFVFLSLGLLRISSGDLNLLISDLSLSVSHQKATSVFF